MAALKKVILDDFIPAQALQTDLFRTVQTFFSRAIDSRERALTFCEKSSTVFTGFHPSRRAFAS